MQKEACMLIKITSLHVAWAALGVNLSCSNFGTMILAQYPLVSTSMAKSLQSTIFDGFAKSAISSCPYLYGEKFTIHYF